MDLALIVSLGLFETPKRPAIKTSFDRMELIKESLYEWYLPKAPYNNLWDLWESYLKLPEENTKQYEQIKTMLVNLIGESRFYDIIHCTTFLHQDSYLQSRGLSEDVISKEYRI